jgi:large conductance mechanosensitive channel
VSTGPTGFDVGKAIVAEFIIAVVIFIVIKKVLAAFEKKEEEEKEEPGPTEVDILTEIRDQLKKQNG